MRVEQENKSSRTLQTGRLRQCRVFEGPLETDEILSYMTGMTHSNWKWRAGSQVPEFPPNQTHLVGQPYRSGRVNRRTQTVTDCPSAGPEMLRADQVI